MDYYLLPQIILLTLGTFLGGVVASKLKQPLIVGYILFGLLLGFITSIFFEGTESVLVLTEVSLALILFTVGLDFSVNKVQSIGKAAIVASLMQLVIITGLISVVGSLVFQFPLPVCIFVGLAFSFSSTVVLVNILTRNGELDTRFGTLIMSWVTVQNLALIPILLIVPILTSQGGLVLRDLLFSLVVSVVIIYLIFLLGRKTLPYLFNRLSLYNNREVLLISAFLVLVLVSSTFHMLGLGYALGAYIAGILLCTSVVNHNIFTEIKPLRGLFLGIFFVSLGFLINIGGIINVVLPAILLSLLVMLLKVLVVLILIVFLKYHTKTAFLSSIALLGIGEFSYILAKVGYDRGVLEPNIYQVIILSGLITIVTTEYLNSYSSLLYKKIEIAIKKVSEGLYEYIFIKLNSDVAMPMGRKLNLNNHTIIVGIGALGKNVCKALDFSGISYLVVDLHYKTIFNLRKRGINSVYGDASNLDILRKAGIETAKSVVITTSDYVTNEIIINNCRKLNPEIKVLVHATADIDVAKLTIRGVKHIVEPGFESSLQFSRRVLMEYRFSGDDVGYIIDKVRQERKY